MTLTTTAIMLGVLEGLTEFLPVSSTGHLILATKLLGYDAARWAVFNIVIQMGAILAVVVQFWPTFRGVLQGMLRGEKPAWHFVRNIGIAFVPAVVLGVLLKHEIDALLADGALVVAWALLLGGFAILVIERLIKPTIYLEVDELAPLTALGIGTLQCLAMIPGVSRSGATIMGALSLGVDRRTATEFSFFLAVPTMLGATVLQLWDNRHTLLASTTEVGPGLIALGFVVAFVVALGVIKAFMAYISRHGFAPFAIYRIVLGLVAIVVLTSH